MARVSILRTLSLILLAALCVYLAGNGSIGLWDRDEPRYAQCSREMLQGSLEHPGSDLVVPRFLGELRAHKPPMIYWLQSAAMRLLGDNAFAARFPSTIAVLITAAMLGLTISRAVGPIRAIWTVLIFCSTGVVIVAAKLCVTDAVLMMWVTTIHLCLYAIRSGWGSWKVVLTLWVAVALGGLTKGPSVIAMPLLTLVVLMLLEVGHQWRSGRAWLNAIGWWKKIHPLVGIPLVVAIVYPWIHLVQQRAPLFIPLLLDQAAKHSATDMEQHSGPPGYYLLTIWATFFPWCLLLPTVVTFAWRHRTLPAIRFGLAAAIGPWLFWELIVKTKLPHYVLPMFPALAFLTADTMVRAIRKQYDDVHRTRFVIGTGVWSLIVIGLGLAPWALGSYIKPIPTGATILVAITAIVYAAVVFIAFQRRAIVAAGLSLGGGMFVLLFVLMAAYLPNLPFLKLSQEVAAVLRREGATRPGQQIMIDYKEPSLAFYQGGTIRESQEGDITRWPRWIVLTREIWDGLSPAAQSQFRVVQTLTGCAYAAQGRIVTVMVLENRRGDEAPLVRNPNP